ncbi:MAG: hypothetical protein P4L10_15235 [Acidobacteriaceae bacterium]|nr:hypothetical protein [Acidobacteriaceae bacterium]
MKRLWLLFVLAMFSLNTWGQSQTRDLTNLPTTTEEQTKLYSLFLDGYLDKKGHFLNVSAMTFPLQISDEDHKIGGCAADISDRQVAQANRTPHNLDATIALNRKIKLVDPRKHKFHDPEDDIRSGNFSEGSFNASFNAGLFWFSEIVFNLDHSRAMFTYTFRCGLNCGHGSMMIYDLHDQVWPPSKLECSHWQS